MTVPLPGRRRLLLAGAVAGVGLGLRPLWAADTPPLTLCMQLSSRHAQAEAVRAGFAFGLDEARQTAALLGRRLDVVTEGPADWCLAALDDDALAALAARRGERLIAIRAREVPDCGAALGWQLTPSGRRCAEAWGEGLQQLGLPAPGLSGCPEAPPALDRAIGVTLARPVAWHPSLTRFGAAQLNQRFRDHSGQPMDEYAWYGWLAVKLALEAGLRDTTPAALRFDGHKGRPLGFADHRLQQPLYLPVQRNGQWELLDV